MVMHSPIMMSTEATSENFDETAYLAQNGDVARAIKAGMFASAWDRSSRPDGRKAGASGSPPAFPKRGREN